jgi:hypothetical protein
MPAGVTYEPLATTTLGTAATNITFSSISGSYTDLRVVFLGRCTTSENAYVRFNSDTGTSYSRTALYGTGSLATSSRSSSATSISAAADFVLPTATDTFAMVTLDIFSYAGSTNKTCLLTYANEKNSSGEVNRTVGLWRNTSAITTVAIFTSDGGNFAIGSRATLYGIKNSA